MLGIDPKAARAAWTVFLIALLIATAYAIRATLVILAISLFFAYMLMPVVETVYRHTPRKVSPTIALAIVYLALIGVLVGLGFTLGSKIAEEANTLATQFPKLVQNGQWANEIPLPSWLDPVRDRIVSAIKSQFTGGQDLLPYLKDIPGKLVELSHYVLDIVLVPILAFFFLKDGAQMREALVESFVDVSGQRVLDGILTDINHLLGKYIRALVLLSLSSFSAYSIFLGITGASYAVLVAGIAALLEFIPVVGPLAGGILIIVVTGVSGYAHVLWFAIFWICFRLFQDYILSPNLMGAGVELNPVLVLFGVLAGERIAGVAGMFFSVPVLASLRVIYVRLQRARRRKELSPEPVEV